MLPQLLARWHGTPLAPRLLTAAASATQRASVQHARLMATQQRPDATEELFVGGYTPITKKLWLDRRNHQQQAGQEVEPVAPVQQPQAQAGKAPECTTVVYRFTTDKLMAEMVSRPVTPAGRTYGAGTAVHASKVQGDKCGRNRPCVRVPCNRHALQ